MVKDHCDSEKGNPLPPHRLLLSINSKGSFISTSHRQVNAYHGLCYTSSRALAGTRNSSMGPPHEGSIRRPIASWVNALTTELHLALREFAIQSYLHSGVKFSVLLFSSSQSSMQQIQPASGSTRASGLTTRRYFLTRAPFSVAPFPQ